mgnify:CR=1 FL=1
MESLKNLKVVNLCWSCGKAHDDVAYEFTKRDKTVKCECGGDVVSRSGKVQMAIVPAIPVWIVDDGETHRWAAASIEEVRASHKEMYGDDLDEEVTITQLIEPGQFTRKFILSDETLRKHRSINDVISEIDTFPALISTSVW